MEFTKETTLEEVLEDQKSKEVLANYQVPCLSCPMAAREMAHLSLGQIAKQYDLDLDSILEDLNDLDL